MCVALVAEEGAAGGRGYVLCWKVWHVKQPPYRVTLRCGAADVRHHVVQHVAAVGGSGGPLTPCGALPRLAALAADDGAAGFDVCERVLGFTIGRCASEGLLGLPPPGNFEAVASEGGGGAGSVRDFGTFCPGALGWPRSHRNENLRELVARGRVVESWERRRVL